MMTLQIAGADNVSQANDYAFLYVFAALVIGFMLKVLHDALKSPSIEILAASKEPYPVQKRSTDGLLVIRAYNAYRIKVQNKQNRYLHCAAENCIAWLELASAPEAYLLSWVGAAGEVTINVGDVREVDIFARDTKTGQIVAPTERGYFEPSPRVIGDGTHELTGKLRITCRNGKRVDKSITVKPTNSNLLEIVLD